MPRDYLFVDIDDFSRKLYAAILPDKTQNSATTVLRNALARLNTPILTSDGMVFIQKLSNEAVCKALKIVSYPQATVHG